MGSRGSNNLTRTCCAGWPQWRRTLELPSRRLHHHRLGILPVCYSRKTCANEACSDFKSTTRSWQTPPCTNSRSILSKGAAGKPPQHAAQPEFAPASPRQLSALDQSNYIASRYPMIAGVSASCSPTEGAECAGYPPCDHNPAKHPD